jgi:hypothetical protein
LPQTGISGAISEALLLVDDPGSGIPNLYGVGATVGSGAPQTLCPTPLTGCTEYVQPFTVLPNSSTGIPAGTVVNVASNSPTTLTPAANVFQGIVNGNSITFYGVPILAPSITGVSRTLRITNVRVNATPFADNTQQIATGIQAAIHVAGVPLSISNAEPAVGIVQSALSASAGSAPALDQCTNQTLTPAATLSFGEQFPFALKTRINAQVNQPYAGQGVPGSNGLPGQNIPGAIYNSESNFVLPVNSTQTAGLADFGTRLRATFDNVPAGVRIFVSTVNVLNNGLPVPAPSTVGGSSANNGVNGYAQLVNSETGAFQTASASGVTANGVPVAEIQLVNGSGVAVWEVVNTNINVNETLRFGVYASYTANPAQNSPPPGTAGVNLSFAPAPPAFTAGNAAAASSTLPIPRFMADPIAARDLLTITTGTCAALGITKTHTGNFTQGQQGATYSVTVTNAITGAPTSGTVTVTETVPGGMTLVSMAGPGWTCPGTVANNCTRADVLAKGSSYPLTVTVNVDGSAPSQVINQVSVSGGGSPTSTATDPTTINPNVPLAGPLTPSSGSGASQTFSAQYTNPGGASNFTSAFILINNGFVASNSCYVDYQPGTNSLYLMNDGATALLGPITPGSGATLQNTQCTLNGSTSSAIVVGTTLTLNASLTFNPVFAGNKTVFIFAYTATANTGFQTGGAWTVTAAIPTAGPLSPSSGSGSAQTFSAQYTNPGGASGFTSAFILINNSFAASNSC